jgi:branched-chain amino acid transport system substrate-binding protein
MRTLFWTLVPVLAISCLNGCNRKVALEPILLGHLAPLSGPQKAVGEHARQGILLAVEAANKDENQVIGRHVAVLHVDTLGELDTLQPEAVRLLTVNRVQGLLGGLDLAQVGRIARDVQQYGVPLITADGLPSQGTGDYLFSVNVPPGQRGAILARFAAQKWKTARLALLSDSRSAPMTALATAFAKEWVKLGGTHPEEGTYQSDTELAELIGRLAKSQPAVLLLAAPAADLPKLRRQLPGALRQVPILLGGEETLPGDPEASEGVYLATVYVASGKAHEHEFAKTFDERFHETPDRHAALAFDSARLLFEAMRRAQSMLGTKVRDELVRLENFESVTGSLTIGRDHYARRAVFVIRMENGQVQLVQRFEGGGD